MITLKFIIAAVAGVAHTRGALALAVGLTLALAGCASSSRLGRVPRGFQGDREAGVAVIGDVYTLSSNTTVATTQPVHFTVKSNKEPAGKKVYPDYRAYLHPVGVHGMMSNIGVTFSEPVITVPDGWAYLVGRYPAGRTGRIRAIGQGTQLIIEIDSSGGSSVHRVYFVSGSKNVDIFVPPNAEAPVYSMETPGTYVESAADNAWEFKGPYSENAARAAFVRNVLDEVRSKGVR
jgi:hypothetical protein